MKRWILFTFLLLPLWLLARPVKVVESSANRAPKWIGISMEDYVIVSAEAPTLDEAKTKCLTDIRQAIATSVAVNVSSEEVSLDRQHFRSNKGEYQSDYTSRVKSVAGQLPFFSGIDLSKGEVFWQRCLVKSEKRYYYICHVKYPFSKGERAQLIAQFNKQDRAYYERFLALKAEVETFTQIDFIEEASAELERLGGYFFDDMRRREVEELKNRYRRCYDLIRLIPYDSRLGEYIFALDLNGRRMTTSRPIRALSQLATNIVVVPLAERLYAVRYNYESCLPEDNPTINLAINLGSNTLRHTIYFDVRKSVLQVIPFGCVDVHLSLQPTEQPATTQVEAVAVEEVPVEEASSEQKAPALDSHQVDSLKQGHFRPTKIQQEALDALTPPIVPVVDEVEPTQIAQGIYDVEVRLWLRSRYDSDFVVTALDLEMPGLGSHLATTLQLPFKGVGEHVLVVPLSMKLAPTNKRVALATGFLKLKNNHTGEEQVLRVSLPYRLIRQER